jgi:branched-subunit amino acid permease
MSAASLAVAALVLGDEHPLMPSPVYALAFFGLPGLGADFFVLFLPSKLMDEMGRVLRPP